MSAFDLLGQTIAVLQDSITNNNKHRGEINDHQKVNDGYEFESLYVSPKESNFHKKILSISVVVLIVSNKTII